MEEAKNSDQEPRVEPSLWLSDTLSPYGLSDEDATLRQADSAKWRTWFGTQRSKRFVAVKADPKSRQHTEWTRASKSEPHGSNARSTPNLSHGTPTRSLSSVMFAQTVCAALVVIGSMYGAHMKPTWATQIKSVLSHLYSADYSQEVVPTLQKIWTQVRSTALNGPPSTSTNTKPNA